MSSMLRGSNCATVEDGFAPASSVSVVESAGEDLKGPTGRGDGAMTVDDVAMDRTEAV
jgi:hypothetical protein